MNKRRRFKAKRRRNVGLRQHRLHFAGTYEERRIALLWLRAHDGMAS